MPRPTRLSSSALPFADDHVADCACHRPHLPCACGTGRSRGASPRRSLTGRGILEETVAPGHGARGPPFLAGASRSVGRAVCTMEGCLMGSRALGGRVAPPARAVRCASRRSVLIGRGHPCGCAIKCDHPKKYHLIRHTNERNHTLFTHPGPRAKCGRHHMKYANLCALVCNRVFRKPRPTARDKRYDTTRRNPHFARTSAKKAPPSG